MILPYLGKFKSELDPVRHFTFEVQDNHRIISKDWEERQGECSFLSNGNLYHPGQGLEFKLTNQGKLIVIGNDENEIDVLSPDH